jgi:hypothetical protein
MRSLLGWLVVAFTLSVFTAPVLAAQPVTIGERKGQVQLADGSATLDSKAKKQILAIVEAILKQRSDALLMIEGDMATEKDPELYIGKSLTLAKEVELFLRDSITAPLDIIIACRKLKPGNNKEGSVKFSVMPSSFKADKLTEKRRVEWVLVEKGESFEITEYADAPTSPTGQTAEPLYIDPQLERKLAQQRQAAQRAVAEQSRKADDLVTRSKAKAAEKARKLERASKYLAPLPTDFR